MAVLGLCCCAGFSLVEMSRGYSTDAMLRLLIAIVSLVAKHGLPGLSSRGSEWDHSERCKGATEDKTLCFGDVTSDAYSASCYHKKPLL